jgi:hypothetical protein
MAAGDFKNTVTYTLPNEGDQISYTGVRVKGGFSVEYTYKANGDYIANSAAILTSTITTSGGTGANAIYNNSFNEASSNTFAAYKTQDGNNGAGTGPIGDHTGASISFDSTTGALQVKFQEQYTTNDSEGYSALSDYNQLGFTFIDTAAKLGKDEDLYTTSRTVTISDITEQYDRYRSSSQTTFSTISDSGGSDDTMTAACYCKGTLIMTSAGEIPVEELALGDELITSSGNAEPVIWVGNNTINCERQVHQDKAYPVRILKDAFGLNLPKRDLYVSPDHSLYIDGVMIPAYCLVNGTTITQDKTEKMVTYYHVELPKHHAILAEGMPAESYLETSEENRHFFKQSNTSNVTKMDVQYVACPEDTPAWKHIWDTQGYAPLTQSGPILESVKAKLALRALESSKKEERQAA